MASSAQPSRSRSLSLSRITSLFTRTRSGSRPRENETRQQSAPEKPLNVPLVRGRSSGGRLVKRNRSQSTQATRRNSSSVFRPSSRPASAAPSAWPPKNYNAAEQVGWRPPSTHNSEPSRSRPGSVRSSGGDNRGSSRTNSATRAVEPPNSSISPDETKSRRRSWLFGGTRKKKPSISEQPKARAWIAGHAEGRVPYDLGPLLNAGKVPELWDSNGDTLVYLFPRARGRGPSFKIRSSVYASSPGLTQLAYSSVYPAKPVTSNGKKPSRPLEVSMQSLNVGGAFTPPLTPKNEESVNSRRPKGSRRSRDSYEDKQVPIHLFLSLTLSNDANELAPTEDDIETLIAVRNFFAFLVGQSLIATEHRSSLFFIFLKIAAILQSYSFSNLDCSTFGELPAASFESYVDELGLADVRSNWEKTIEGLILGEKMRSKTLYNEAFVHAAGRYDEILVLVEGFETSRAKFHLISATTRSRLERSSIDLFHRQKSIETRLIDFEFPSIFAGIMNSRTADERKSIRFGEWKDSFLATRKHVLHYYKQKFGSWPPDASSKKNNLKTSGLNREVLRVLYKDFSDLYDLLVDRTSLTTRVVDDMAEDGADDPELPVSRVLRRVFDEYDRSSPPVQPPVPFDLPLLPSLSTIRQDYETGNFQKDLKARAKKLADIEISALTDSASNPDMLPLIASSPFLTTMRSFEKKEGRGRNVTGLTDLRAGLWIFLYAVLQALPMLVVDAPGVRYSRGVEYFLCQPPRSSIPWAVHHDDSQAGVRRPNAGGRKSWYNIAGSTGMVNLPSDLVEHGVEGVYRRSHCWLVAVQWSNIPSIADLAPGWDEAPHSESPAATSSIVAEDFTRGATIFPRSESSRPKTSTAPHSRVASSAWSGQGNVSPAVSDYPAPSPAGPRNWGSRPASPSRGRTRNTVVALGLEALPLPAGVSPITAPSSQQSRDASLAPLKNTGQTFDDIFRSIEKSKAEQASKDKKEKKRSSGIKT